MSKILIGLAAIVLTACNNDSKSSSGEDTTTTTTNMSGVENVNGNIPDTTNTLKVEGSSQTSDTKVDSTKKQ